jgi:hypothetical protein
MVFSIIHRFFEHFVKYSYLLFLFVIYLNTLKFKGGFTMLFEVIIFFIFMIILLGGIGTFFWLLKSSLNGNDADLIDPKPSIIEDKKE